MYGSLGNDYENSYYLTELDDYSASPSNGNFAKILDTCFKLSKNIKTIRSEKCPKEEIETINSDFKKRIENATKIFILGYGFDITNSGIIGLGNGVSRIVKTSPLKVCYLNFNGQNKIDRKFFDLAEINLECKNSLLKNNHCALPGLEYFRSTKDVYHALAEDFEL